MNGNIGKLLKVLDIESMEVDANRSDTYHHVKHKFRDEIILPLAAISNNVDFLIFDKAKKHVRTSDDVECVVEWWSEEHICDIEADIKSIYGLDAWTYLKTWHKHEPCMTSMHFIKMKIKKYDSTID